MAHLKLTGVREPKARRPPPSGSMSFDFLSLRRARPDAAPVVGLHRRHARADARHDRRASRSTCTGTRRTARSTCIRRSATSSASGCGSRPAWSRKEWTAIHRKHHAKVRDRRGSAQPADARHCARSSVEGTELYRAEAKNPDTLEQLRQGHARRLDGAQRLHALFVGRRRPDARGQPRCCSAPSARRSGPCRWRGFRCSPPASSTASATSGAIATSPPPTRRRTSCRGAS